jgi:hypothetical protein
MLTRTNGFPTYGAAQRQSWLAPLLAAVLATGAWTAEPDLEQPVAVPDPIGLGERLALIDWLREHKLTVPEDAKIAELRRAYLVATTPEAFAEPVKFDAEREALSLALWKRHSVSIKPDQTNADLALLLKRLDTVQERALQHDQERARSGGATPEESTPPAITSDAPAPGKKSPDDIQVSIGKAPAVPAAMPPLDDDHRDRWANYGFAPTSTKDRMQLWVYVLKGERTRYYILADNRTGVSSTAEFTIDDDRFTLTIPAGRGTVPTPVETKNFSSTPSIMINSVKAGR